MLVVLKILKMFCLALLAVSIIISTIWIIEAYFHRQENFYLNLAALNWISWYVTAPLLVLYFLLKGVGEWIGAGKKWP